jgi:hypothetical protein
LRRVDRKGVPRRHDPAVRLHRDRRAARSLAAELGGDLSLRER